jgi:hypothetical protein
MNLKRKFERVVFAIASCSFLFINATLIAENSDPAENILLEKGQSKHRRVRGFHGHHGHLGHRGHHGHHGHGGPQGNQGPQGVHGLQGAQGTTGPRGFAADLGMCTSWGFDPGSEESFDLYACSLQNIYFVQSDPQITINDIQFLQPAPLFKGYVPPGSRVTFTGFVKGNYPIDPYTTIEGKFKIQTEGAGQYLIHYGLVGVPNGIRNEPAGPYTLLSQDFLETSPSRATCWICIKIIHSNGQAEYLGAIPLSLTATRNAQAIPVPQPAAPNNFSTFVLEGYGQVSRHLNPGDEVTLMIMLASLNQDFRNVPLQTPYMISSIPLPYTQDFPENIGQFNDPNSYNGQFAASNRILHINANNTIYRWNTPPDAGAINLSGGPTLSIVRIGD